VTEDQPANAGTLGFFKEVTKYFMDFLETDFHKATTPKRAIKSRNSSNLLVSFNLRKYDTFYSVIAKHIYRGFPSDVILQIKKGQHKTKLPRNVVDLIELQVSKISKAQLEELISIIAQRVEQEAVLNGDDFDLALTNATDEAGVSFYTQVIHPFIVSLQKPIINKELGDESDIFMMEQELVDTFVEKLKSKISEVLRRLIAKEEFDIFNELLETVELKELKETLTDHFANMRVADLFDEVKDLDNNKSILDKQDFYLYFGDIAYKSNKYPMFYIPINLVKLQDSYQLEFDSQIYINKKALEFIAEDFNKDRGTLGTLKTVTERIIYLSQHTEDLHEVLENVIAEIQTFFELKGSINFQQGEEMQARGAEVNISNTMFFALFDKSDEALVNDYEEILSEIALNGGDLSGAFQQLLTDFLQKNPESVALEVENEWDETDTPSKLVAYSPIPLNAEQLQILNAVKKPNAKYIIVEGPPGTGKSHTITAIIFDAILNSKSVLVLSDKKEALDVVEKNITETMNKVRFDQNFQNPILRLGKTGNTYSQILSKSSITDMKTHYRAVKADASTLDNTIEKSANTLKDDIELETIAYSDVDISEIREYMELEDSFTKKPTFSFDIIEVFDHEMGCYDIGAIREGLVGFQEITNHKTFAKLRKLLGINPQSFLVYADMMASIGRVSGTVETLKSYYSFKLESLSIFTSFNLWEISLLQAFITEYKEQKRFLFGYSLSKGKLAEIDSRFSSSFDCIVESPSSNLTRLYSAFSSLILIKIESDRLNVELETQYDFVALIHQLMTSTEMSTWIAEIGPLAENIDRLTWLSSQYPKSFKKMKINLAKLDTLADNTLMKTDEGEFDRQLRYVQLKQGLESAFGKIPDVDYAGVKKSIEQLLITKVAHQLDGRVINFYENSRNDAATLRSIIRGKQKFPKDQFGKLSNAFPCILAGIRDFAEYIPLHHQMFDLLIIDEASQVSLAQAFPALIRANKVVILGDKKQFSNIKANQARSDTNREYLSRLERSFKKNVSKDPAQLVRLGKFNIKTSVLDFFEFISNYSMQLTKHFRGYKEIISYSNRYFYRGSLQVMKIRAKNIDDVIKFSFVKAIAKDELHPNTNMAEVEFIKKELVRLKGEKSELSVGIITPHTNQQKLLVEEIGNMPERDFFVDNFKLKIMTFDTCQGEERDIIFYSMVVTEESDKLWGIFIKDLANVNIEEDGQIKAQRLNVGFSRGKEQIHFVLSKPLDKFTGSIGEALRHYAFELEEAKREKTVAETDANSMMEPEVLNWFYQTDFWNLHKSRVTFVPQFEIGKYLKQLDPTYTHPFYKVDFLVAYRDSADREKKIIIEYDGFSEHFKKSDWVNEFNFESYQNDGDVYRQKVLESYGYSFIRINKFNVGANPVETLNRRLMSLIKPELKVNPLMNKIYLNIENLQSGEMKECPKCKQVKLLKDFKDQSLARGIGRFCRSCKGVSISGHAKTYAGGSSSRSDSNCPRCGAKMVRRTGKNGTFYGCTRYPYCKGTR
jgi:superfamily I DNA and/or RNA helicase/very-short-patch-repair endonuclease